MYQLLLKNKTIVYIIIALLVMVTAVFVWNNYEIKLSERPIKPFRPLSPPAELTVIVIDAKTEKPIEDAMVEVKEMVSCPDVEGYPCPQGLVWQTKTNKQGQALFTDQTLKGYITKNLAEFSYVILALNISVTGYQGESKEILYSPNKELIKKDFGLSPPGDQRVIYNPKEKVFAVKLFKEETSVPPGVGVMNKCKKVTGSERETQETVTSTSVPVNIVVNIDRAPRLNETGNISWIVCADWDMPQVNAFIELPNGVQLVTGTANWQGNLPAGSLQQLSATIKVTKEGIHEIKGVIRTEPKEDGSFWSSIDLLYLTVTATGSKIGLPLEDRQVNTEKVPPPPALEP